MDKLSAGKVENIQKLAKLSFDDLYSGRKQFFKLYGRL